jgi:hypothetical protein
VVRVEYGEASAEAVEGSLGGAFARVCPWSWLRGVVCHVGARAHRPLIILQVIRLHFDKCIISVLGFLTHSPALFGATFTRSTGSFRLRYSGRFPSFIALVARRDRARRQLSSGGRNCCGSRGYGSCATLRRQARWGGRSHNAPARAVVGYRALHFDCVTGCLVAGAFHTCPGMRSPSRRNPQQSDDDKEARTMSAPPVVPFGDADWRALGTARRGWNLDKGSGRRREAQH